MRVPLNISLCVLYTRCQLSIALESYHIIQIFMSGTKCHHCACNYMLTVARLRALGFHCLFWSVLARAGTFSKDK